ncbi:MAG: hypothetical protein WC071_01440 [Victivallaceae bacterium]
MKGLFFVTLVILALVGLWGWSCSKSLDKSLTEMNSLKTKLSAAETKATELQASLDKTNTTLRSLEQDRNALRRKLDNADKSSNESPAVAQATPEMIQPPSGQPKIIGYKEQKINGVVVGKTPIYEKVEAPATVVTAVAVPVKMVDPAVKAQAEKLKNDINDLTFDLKNLNNQIASKERELSNIKNFMITKRKKKGWYYRDYPGHIYRPEDYNSRSMRNRPVTWIMESKEEIIAVKSKPVEQELKDLNRQKNELERKLEAKNAEYIRQSQMASRK